MKNNWISINDNLPQEDRSVLIHRQKDDVVSLGYIEGGVWYDMAFTDESRDYETANVTHWMPLPEPPKQTT